MAGIYIHIPFCKKACNYCDFHFSTSLDDKQAMLESIKKELRSQTNFLNDSNPEDQIINSIYFGGGTPSLLETEEIKSLLATVYETFTISVHPEITLEANPDDLTEEKLQELKEAGINRLSIGVQSFFDEDLKFMNRAHDSEQAIMCIKNAHALGFNNITIDLIYGTPTLSDEKWTKNIQTAIDFGIPHISAYCLTVEPKTALASQIQKGKTPPLNESQAARQFEILQQRLTENNFLHYEISNFCKEGFYSRHNSNYWLKGLYLGVGPSAHSFNGKCRQWNISNNKIYIKNIDQNLSYFEKETLSEEQRYNEYVLTSLRTMWGTSLDYISKQFGPSSLTYCKKEAEKYIRTEHLLLKENTLFLTNKGKLFADKIASDLFLVEDVRNH